MAVRASFRSSETETQNSIRSGSATTLQVRQRASGRSSWTCILLDLPRRERHAAHGQCPGRKAEVVARQLEARRGHRIGRNVGIDRLLARLGHRLRIDEGQVALRLARAATGAHHDLVVARATDAADELPRKGQRTRHLVAALREFEEPGLDPETASGAVEAVTDDRHAARRHNGLDRLPLVAEVVAPLDQRQHAGLGVEAEHSLPVGQEEIVFVDDGQILR